MIINIQEFRDGYYIRADSADNPIVSNIHHYTKTLIGAIEYIESLLNVNFDNDCNIQENAYLGSSQWEVKRI